VVVFEPTVAVVVVEGGGGLYEPLPLPWLLVLLLREDLNIGVVCPDKSFDLV